VKENLQNTVLRLEAHTSCIEQERLPSNFALVITRKVKQADTKWEHILRRLWEMGNRLLWKWRQQTREGVMPIIKRGRQPTYKVTLRHVRATVVAAEKQYLW